MDDDSSLLQDHQPNFQNEFFGQFKGFRLSPISVNNEDTKGKRPVPTVPSVPSIPTVPNVVIKNANRTQQGVYSTAPVGVVKPRLQPTNNDKQNGVASAVVSSNATSIAPALPPLNPGANPRPLISSPILKASTCTAKELISPLRTAPKIPNVPTRPAPEAPENPRPLSSPVNPSVAIILEETQNNSKPKESGSTLNRIASFLKSKEDKNKPVVTPQNNVKVQKTIDKNTLKSLEISNPILQNTIHIAENALPVDNEKTKAVVMRAQSMRGTNVTPRPNIQTFGSMRQPNGAKRPTSIPVGNRPKSPPPPRPPLPDMTHQIEKIPGLPGYQEPKAKPKPVGAKNDSDYQYDDCLNEAPLAKISEEISPGSGDNIYAVIEETPKSLSSGKSNSDSSESVGLLGEIVTEIQNRNFDSIYSTSTLARKKKESLEMDSLKPKGDNIDSAENYVNTSSFYKTPESIYSNMGNLNQSSASSTASGYIHPSAVNAPKVVASVTFSDNRSDSNNKVLSPKDSLSTFKTDNKLSDISSYKPYHSTLQRSAGPFAATFNKTSPVTKTESTFKPTIIDKKPNTMDKKPEVTFKPIIVDKNIETTVKIADKIEPIIINPKVVEKQLEPVKSPPEKTEKQEVKSPTSPNSKPKTVGRQVTPVNLRTRRPSPSRPVATPKNTTKPPTSNSPDLVISCSTTNTSVKSPDVLNSSAKMNGKPNSVLPKPVIATKNGPLKTTKNLIDRKPIGKSPIVSKLNTNKSNSEINKTNVSSAKLPVKTQPSNVAALQQKFENKTQATKTK